MPDDGTRPYTVSRLLVGIANPDTVASLMSLAAHVANYAGCEVIATHIVTEPTQVTLSSARSSPEVVAAEELLRQAIRAGAAAGVQVRGVVELAREAHTGLTCAVTDQEADVLLVGYSDVEPGRDAGERAFDRLMHRIARSITADLIVAKFRRETISSILVPIAGDHNLAVTGLVVKAIRAGTGAEVRFLHVVEPGANPQDDELGMRNLLSAHGLREVGEFEIVRTASPTATIIERADAHDMAIIGAEARPSLADAIFGNAAERIASEASCTVLVVRARKAGG